MTLREAQVIFIKNVPALISKIFTDGYECTYGETWRPYVMAWINAKPKGCTLKIITPDGIESIYPELVGGTGVLTSLHINRTAIDLNLFKDGTFLTTTEAHKPFGDYWETLHPLNRWGGRWKDGNHYELNWKG